MATRSRPRLSSVDAGWDASARSMAGPSRKPEDETRTINVEELDALLESSGSGYEGATASLSAGEIDDLLEPAAGPGAAPQEPPFRGAGFGKGREPARPAGPDAAGRWPLDLDDEVGAAFDSLETPEPSAAGPPAAALYPFAARPAAFAPDPRAGGSEDSGDDEPTRDSQPTTVDAYSRGPMPAPALRGHQPAAPAPPQAAPATVALHAWGQTGEPATVDLRSWMAASGAGAPPIDDALPPAPRSHDGSSASWPTAALAPPAHEPASASWPAAALSPPPLRAGPRPAAGVVRPAAGGGVIQGEETSSGAAGSRAGIIAALLMSLVTVVGITAYLISHSPAPPETPAGAQPPAPRPATTSSPNPAAAAPPAVSSEVQARAALQRLAGGVKACARDIIGVLPGTSPPVPSAFRLMKDGVYTTLPGDYRSPVFSCTGFRIAEPQPFQVQWQVFKGGNEGMAIVWLDTDSDARADRALGLRARLVKKGEVEIAGDVEVLEPLPAVVATR